MDLIKMLDSIDFIDGRVDLNSIHPTNLLKLVEEGYIEKIDPGDGEPCFYVLSDSSKVYIIRDQQSKQAILNDNERIKLYVNSILRQN